MRENEIYHSLNVEKIIYVVSIRMNNYALLHTFQTVFLTSHVT